MKQCPKCSTKNQDVSSFCSSCGEYIGDVEASSDDFSVVANEFLGKARNILDINAKKAKEAAIAGTQRVQQAASDGITKAQEWQHEFASQREESANNPRNMGDSVFVDPDEHIVATIGSNYVQNFFTDGDVSRNIGILTQKRFYFKGKNISGTGKNISSATEEGIVSLEDIGFTKFTHIRKTGYLIFAILMTLFSLLCANMEDLASILFIMAIPFYCLYFIKRSSLFLVSFAGGEFTFDIRWYPIVDIRDFQRQLHLLKDHIKFGQYK